MTKEIKEMSSIYGVPVMYISGLTRYIHAPSGHDNGNGNGHGHGLKSGDNEVVRKVYT